MTTGNATTSTATTGKRALIVGATSSLAQAIAHILARDGYALLLAARDEEELALLAGDLSVRHGAACAVMEADFIDPDFTAESFVEQAWPFDCVIIAAGMMGSGDPADMPNIVHTVHVNYTLPAQIAQLAALRLAEKKQGSVVILSSVAGERGRQSNYAYGSAKAALTSFASGLRNALFKRGVHVMTVKPGFIDTPMTWGMGSPLIASREYAARRIVAAMHERRDVIYVPAFWSVIMWIIRCIPEGMFKRMRL